jgi:hypothetical protein
LATPAPAHNSAFAGSTCRCGNDVDIAIGFNSARYVLVKDKAGQSQQA